MVGLCTYIFFFGVFCSGGSFLGGFVPASIAAISATRSACRQCKAHSKKQPVSQEKATENGNMCVDQDY